MTARYLITKQQARRGENIDPEKEMHHVLHQLKRAKIVPVHFQNARPNAKKLEKELLLKKRNREETDCPVQRQKNCKEGVDECKAVKRVAMKKVGFKQTVKGITKEQCASVKGAIQKGTAKQLKIDDEGVTVKEEGAGVCVQGSRRRLATGSQAFAVEAQVEASKVEEAKKTLASDAFQTAIVSEASQAGVKDLKTDKVEAGKIEESEVEDGRDGAFVFGTIVFGVFALLL